MTVFGKPPSAYVAFSKGVALLILVVGLAKLGLSLAGVSNSATRWLAMNGVYFFGLIYLAVRVHTTKFGTYTHLLPSLLLPSLMLHGVAIAGIVIGMITGQDNVYTAPEYAFGQDGKTPFHLLMHVVVGIPASTVFNWIFGCLILFITTKLARRNA
jgi:hypothetical protein